MPNTGQNGSQAELRELKKQLKKQTADLVDSRMTAGDLKSEVVSLRKKLAALERLPLSHEDHSDQKALLDHYLDIVLSILDTDAGSILILQTDASDGKESLVFTSCAGPGSERLKGWHMSSGDGIAGWVAKHGAPYFTDEADKDDTWDSKVSESIDFETKNILCVPMKAAGRVLGVIEVMNKKGSPFSREDLDILNFISGHAAVMLENVRLLREYDEKVRHMATLMELATLLNSTLRKREVRHRAIEAATRLMEAEVGSLLLVDEKTNELYFEVALGDSESQKKIKEIRLKIGEGIAGWVAKECVPVVINDVQNDPRFFKGADKKTSFVTRNMVCVPVLSKGKLVGVLQAINKLGGGGFSVSDKESFEALANQVAVAIENSKLYDKLRQTFLDTSEALAEAIEKRDPYTGGHTKRVVRYSSIIARHMDLPPDERETLELAAVLHDVGKIGVSDLILGKQAPLDDAEYKKMKEHTVFGAEIMAHVPDLAHVIPGIRDHHERYDGKGYPGGVAGENIPQMARIIAVADTFDAMTTSRPYRAGLSVEYAISELKRCSGTQFEPKSVDAFLSALEAGEVQLGD